MILKSVQSLSKYLFTEALASVCICVSFKPSSASFNVATAFFDYYDLHVYDAYSTLNPSSLVLAILLRHCKYDTCNVHCSGQPLPVVTYTPEEIATWYVLGAFISTNII